MKSVLFTLLRSFRSARLRALLSLGMVLGLGAVGTLAAWSASTTSTSGDFSTGTVDIKLNAVDGTVLVPFTVTAVPSLLPGATTATGAALPIRNTGNVPFQYTTQVRGIGTLGTALTMTVYTGSAFDTGFTTCTGGTAISTAQAITATDTAILGSRGNVGAGSGVDNLCVQFTLLAGAPVSAQSETTSGVQFTFTATGALP